MNSELRDALLKYEELKSAGASAQELQNQYQIVMRIRVTQNMRRNEEELKERIKSGIPNRFPRINPIL